MPSAGVMEAVPHRHPQKPAPIWSRAKSRPASGQQRPNVRWEQARMLPNTADMKIVVDVPRL